jgi:flagellar biosynthesis protein FlhA
MPGLPMLPFLLLAGAMAAIGYVIPLRQKRERPRPQAAEKQPGTALTQGGGREEFGQGHR